MMIEIKIPSPGESISEVEIASWQVKNGDFVEKDQEIAEIESDKATLPLVAEESGKLEILAEEGSTVKVGDVVGKIDTSEKQEKEKKPKNETSKEITKKPSESQPVKVTPVAQKMMNEENLSVDDIISGLKKITKKEVQTVKNFHKSTSDKAKRDISRETNKQKMSQLRKKVSKRLVAVKNETAMLTTFNEVDMSAVMDIRKKYGDAFREKHEVKLGFMSFFTKAVCEALQLFPLVNSMIDDDEIVTPEYCDIGIAVQTPKGLMVPVLRNAELMMLADIESEILALAEKARNYKLSIEEMTGGTFTITNGGIFGSMLSTPIINPPQSAILGMHNIQERPVAVSGKVEIRPMMYLALSYDHRIIDGKESVNYLVKIKELIENPVSMVFDGDSPEKSLLNI